jgi:hypothetical protein
MVFHSTRWAIESPTARAGVDSDKQLKYVFWCRTTRQRDGIVDVVERAVTRRLSVNEALHPLAASHVTLQQPVAASGPDVDLDAHPHHRSHTHTTSFSSMDGSRSGLAAAYTVGGGPAPPPPPTPPLPPRHLDDEEGAGAGAGADADRHSARVPMQSLGPDSVGVEGTTEVDLDGSPVDEGAVRCTFSPVFAAPPARASHTRGAHSAWAPVVCLSSSM